jgi:hypothetical protein
MDCISSSKITTFNYDGDSAEAFIKQIIKLLYDADINDVVFKDGNSRNLTRNNIWVRCI